MNKIWHQFSANLILNKIKHSGQANVELLLTTCQGVIEFSTAVYLWIIAKRCLSSYERSVWVWVARWQDAAATGLSSRDWALMRNCGFYWHLAVASVALHTTRETFHCSFQLSCHKRLMYSRNFLWIHQKHLQNLIFLEHCFLHDKFCLWISFFNVSYSYCALKE